MKSSEYNILIGVLSGVVLVIPFTGKVWDGRRTIYNRIQFRGWVLIGFFLSMVIVTYLKDAKVEDDETEKDKQLDKVRQQSDSIIKSNQFAVIESLANYNLTLDRKTNSIIKIVRDSARRIVNINSSILPSLSINKITLEKVNYPDHLFQIELICSNNNAYNINLKLCTISEGSKGYVYNKHVPFYISGGDLNSGAKTTSGVHVEIKDKTSTKIHFLVEGNYSNLEGKVIPLKQLLYYDLSINKGMMLLSEPEHSKMMKFFTQIAAKF